MKSVRLRIASDHPAFAGHFPGRPLLPGAVLLAEVLEAVRADPELAASVGAAPRLAVAKFLAPVPPGAELSVSFDLNATLLRFEVAHGAALAASGQFERVPSAPAVAEIR